VTVTSELVELLRGCIDAPVDCLIHGFVEHTAEAVEAHGGGSVSRNIPRHGLQAAALAVLH